MPNRAMVAAAAAADIVIPAVEISAVVVVDTVAVVSLSAAVAPNRLQAATEESKFFPNNSFLSLCSFAYYITKFKNFIQTLYHFHLLEVDVGHQLRAFFHRRILF